MTKLLLVSAVLSTAVAATAQCTSGPGPGAVLTQDPFAANFYVGSPLTPSPGFTGFTLLVDVVADTPLKVTTVETWLYDQGAGNPVNPNQVGNLGNVNIYYCATSYVGAATMRPGTAGSPWQPVVDDNAAVVTGTVTVDAFPNRSIVTLSNPAGFVIPQGAFGLAFEFNPPTAGMNPGPLHPLITSPSGNPPRSDQFLAIGNQGFQNDAFEVAASTTDSINLELGYTPFANAGFWQAFGVGCYFDPEAFYEEFNAPGSFDLANSAMTGVAQANSWSFTNVGTTGFVAPTTTSLTANPPAVTSGGTWDDALSAPLGLPFTFQAPGGVATSTITVGSNGHVLLEAATTVSDAFGYYNALADFRDRGPRIAPFWGDLDPSVSGGIYVEHFGVAPNRFTCVTWQGVEEWNAPGSGNTFQLQLHENGNIEIYYQSVNVVSAPALVGYTQGGGAQLQTLDLSAGLAGGFESGDGATPPELTMTRRPAIGSTGPNTPEFLASNIDAASTGLVVFGLNLTGTATGISLAQHGMPGCTFYPTLTGLVSAFVGVTPAGTSAYPFPIPADPMLIGLPLFVQCAPLTPGLNAGNLIVSNAVCAIVGT
ncbi:MAG: hypothetical protein KDE27_09460 [Planctomycetes bacterium]|nr:hypothetical protein [Planctomycetota bacterium]